MLINTCTRVVCVWRSWGKQLHGQYICTFLHTFPLHMHLCTHTHTNTVIMYRTVPYRWELWSDIRGGSVSYHTPLLHLHMTWGCHYCWDGCIVLCSQLHALVCVLVCLGCLVNNPPNGLCALLEKGSQFLMWPPLFVVCHLSAQGNVCMCVCVCVFSDHVCE